MMKLVTFSDSMFDEIFCDGEFTQSRIEKAGILVMYLARQDIAKARRAKRTLGEMLLFAIADQRCKDPQRCAVVYYTGMSTAFGEPRFLDSVPLPARSDRKRRA